MCNCFVFKSKNLLEYVFLALNLISVWQLGWGWRCSTPWGQSARSLLDGSQRGASQSALPSFPRIFHSTQFRGFFPARQRDEKKLRNLFQIVLVWVSHAYWLFSTLMKTIYWLLNLILTDITLFTLEKWIISNFGDFTLRD